MYGARAGPELPRAELGVTSSDAPGGRDNAVVDLYADGGASTFAMNSNFGSESGIGTMVLRVRRYNGAPVDGDIEVAIIGATRSSDLRHGKPNPPSWDGTDVWKAFAEWVLPADGGAELSAERARYLSDRAYVANGVLVAHFPFARGAPGYGLVDTWIQARLQAVGEGRWSLVDGTFAARSSLQDWLGSIEFAADSASGLAYTCTDSQSYPALKTAICALADIGFSTTDPSAPCDGVSWAWRFTALPILPLSGVEPITVDELRKCPARTSPANDTCANLVDGGK